MICDHERILEGNVVQRCRYLNKDFNGDFSWSHKDFNGDTEILS
jgi:hypothetical protein